MAYISKEMVIKHIKDTYEEIPLDVGSRQLIAALKTYIENVPTADVQEVRHGEWFLLDDCANEGVYCSVCHKKVYKKDYANQKLKSPRCPNCGAKMDGGKTE